MRLHDLAPEQRDLLPGIWALDQDIPYYYIAGVINVSEDPDETEYEQLSPYDTAPPDFWSLYLVRDTDDTTVIEDFPTREAALSYTQTSDTIDQEVFDFTHEGFYG